MVKLGKNVWFWSRNRKPAIVVALAPADRGTALNGRAKVLLSRVVD